MMHVLMACGVRFSSVNKIHTYIDFSPATSRQRGFAVSCETIFAAELFTTRMRAVMQHYGAELAVDSNVRIHRDAFKTLIFRQFLLERKKNK